MPKSLKTFLIAFVAFFAGIWLLVSMWNSVFPDETNYSAAGTTATPSTNASKTDAIKPDVEGQPQVDNEPEIFNIGDSVHTGYWTYVVNRVQWTPILIEAGGIYERADAQFLILDITARNDDRTASVLPPIKLVNAADQEFSESSAGSMMQGAFGPLKELNPTVTSRGLVVFDVPRGQYRAVLSGGITSGTNAQVQLPLPPSPQPPPATNNQTDVPQTSSPGSQPPQDAPQ